MAANVSLDNDQWIRTCFGIKNPVRSVADRRMRLESGSRLKFSDTTFGGAKAINAPPAFTEFADLPVKGLLTKDTYTYGNPLWQAVLGDIDDDEGVHQMSSQGLGRSYNDIYDNTGEYITLRFGLPKVNSLLSFFTSFYDYESGVMARTGEAPSLFLKATAAAGTLIGMALSPAFLLTKVVAFLVGKPISRYYYLDPKMHLYWTSANLILNSIMVNTGDIPRVNGRDQSDEDIQSQWNRIQSYYAMMPDIFRKNGGIDLFGVANRYNRLALAFHEAVTTLAIQATSKGAFIDSIRDVYTNSLTGALTGASTPEANAYILRYMNATENQFENLTQEQIESKVLSFERPEVDPNAPTDGQATDPNAVYNSRLSTWSWGEKMISHLESSYNEGGEFITWRVENTGATTESFSTSTGESAIAQGFNGLSGSAAQLKFNAGNFQSGIGLIDSIGAGISSIFGTLASAVSLEGIQAMLGNAFLDVPDIVTGSTSNMPAMNYTMELRPWSNDPITRVMDMHAPIAMALAMILPISTGKHSYALPLICEAYSRSRIVYKLAAVTSMSISRGVSNLARNQDGDPLGVTINWSLTNLQKIVHMPVNVDMGAWSKFAQLVGSGVDALGNAVTGGNGRQAQAGAALISDSKIYDDTTLYTDYMAVLGGLTLQELIYSGQKLKIAMTQSMVNFDQWFSASSAMNKFGSETFFGRGLSLMARGTAATN